MSRDKRRGRPQRRELPAGDAVHEARQLARRRAHLEVQLASLGTERLRVVIELRALGLSVQDVADLLSVSKGRVQQLAHEAHDPDKGWPHAAAECAYPELHPDHRET